MTVLHPRYEFEILENKVYQLIPISFTNAPKQIHITGTGTVDLRGCIETPTTLNDPILTLTEEDTNLSGLYDMGEVNYIKLVQNQAGTRKIILSGFKEPSIILE
jgi:hypothetical protein